MSPLNQANKAAIIPVIKIPSKVPAPPIEATGAPSEAISLSRKISAPITEPPVRHLYRQVKRHVQDQ